MFNIWSADPSLGNFMYNEGMTCERKVTVNSRFYSWQCGISISAPEFLYIWQWINTYTSTTLEIWLEPFRVPRQTTPVWKYRMMSTEPEFAYVNWPIRESDFLHKNLYWLSDNSLIICFFMTFRCQLWHLRHQLSLTCGFRTTIILR